MALNEALVDGDIRTTMTAGARLRVSLELISEILVNEIHQSMQLWRRTGIREVIRKNLILDRAEKILNVDEYIPLQEYVYISNFCNWVYSFVIVVCTFKVFKYLQISPSLSVLIITLNEAIDTLFYFMIILTVLTFGYAFVF